MKDKKKPILLIIAAVVALFVVIPFVLGKVMTLVVYAAVIFAGYLGVKRFMDKGKDVPTKSKE